MARLMHIYNANKKTLVRNIMSAKDIMKLVDEKEAKFIDYRFYETHKVKSSMLP